MPPKITAVVCTRDRPHLLARALGSLTAQTLPRDEYDVLVVNNGDGEDIVFPGVRQIREPRPGLSFARNTALAAAAAPYIAFLDDDAEASPTWLERILAAFSRESPPPGCVGGKVVPVFETPRPGWFPDELLGYLSVVDLADHPIHLRGRQWLAGTNIAFDRRLLEDLGGFPVQLGRRPGTLLGMEEVSVLQKIQRMRLPVLYDPSILVHHHISSSRLTRRWLHRRAFWQGVSDAIADREEGAWLRLPVRALLLALRPWPLATAGLPMRTTRRRVLAECAALLRAGYLVRAVRPSFTA